ncbi:hypothetical protein JVU11DRAFT_5754 [Chiua virens]|nr:hypothetical protein JVU11DRAFT_5754 [Chiua virens]
MATLPRTTKQSSTPDVSNRAQLPDFAPRPRSDHSFDAGINSSAAWTEHLDRGSLSDDEPTDPPGIGGQRGLSARALYHFEGQAEFRELTVEAGDALEVLKQDIGDGWSLVKTVEGKIGLLPMAYYTHTIDFLSAPADSHAITRQASTDTVTPRSSPKGEAELELSQILPQNTGEWPNVFPSFRQRLLGGKTINRFSAFVTSGAEEWVLKGAPEPEDGLAASASTPGVVPHSRFSTTDSVAEDIRLNRLGIGEADRHFVDEGPAWQPKIPGFRVLVHSPSKRSSSLSGAYTVYSVTSLVHAHASEHKEPDGDVVRSASPVYITVQRRFSHFVILHTALLKRLPGIALPPLPEKQYAGRFNAAFVEARRGDLERYLDRLVRHPIARYAEVVTSFLACEDDLEWKRLMPQFLSMPAAGASFFAHVFHPVFNVDMQDASEIVEKFDNYVRAVGKGVQGLRNTFSRVREARIEMSKAERLLSFSLLSLITAKPSSSTPAIGAVEEEENASPQLQGLLNDDGAWCWRDDCQDCLKLTKAVQKTAETLQTVADLYDDHARRRQLATHEALKSVAHPYMTYQGIIETHRSTCSRYADAIGKTSNNDMASRCETVLNATMSELDTYHTQKAEDFTTLTKEHLDGEIALYEQLLIRLRTARRTARSAILGRARTIAEAAVAVRKGSGAIGERDQ